MKSATLQQKLLIITLLPTTLLVLFLSIYYASSAVHDIERSLIERGEAIVKHLAPLSEFALVSGNQEELQRIANTALRDENIQRVTISNLSGKLSVEARRLHTNTLPEWLKQSRPLFTSTPLQQSLSAPIKLTAIPLLDESDVTDAPGQQAEIVGRVTLELNLALITEQQLNTLIAHMLLSLMALVTTVPITIRLANRISRPIHALTGVVEQLSQGSLTARVQLQSDGELGILEEGFNKMTGALQSSQQHLQQEVAKATEELRYALQVLEDKNRQLDIAHQQLLSINRFKSSFLANLSHEIRTPMNSILGYSELLSKNSQDANQQQQLQIISRSANTLLNLINDILDVARVESGSMELENQSCNLNQMMAEIYQLVLPRSYQKGLELMVESLPPEFAQVETDALRLRQVLLNLANNAVKFTVWGHLLLSCKLINHSPQQVDILFCVTDTGIGIDPARQQQMFELFNQGDMSTKRQFSGGGLGLYICQELVSLMQSHIQVVSEVGKGSQFSFRLSLKRSAEPQPAIPIPSTPQRLLLVDDYQPLHQQQRRQLQASGFAVESCHSHDLCAKLQADAPPDALLVNISAQQVLQAELPRLPSEKLPAGCQPIAYLYQPDPDLEQQLQRLGYTRQLFKQMEPTSLREAIDRLLNHEPGENSSAEAITDKPVEENREGESERTLTVLAVDDHQVNLELLSEFFSLLNTKAECAQSGRAALERQAQKRYDLIFMDIHMPNLDGMETSRQIRTSNSPNRETPIIALTADVDRQRIKEALDAGMNDLITKPVSLKGLREILNRWRDHAQPTAAAELPTPETEPSETQETATETTTLSTQLAEIEALPLIDAELGLQMAAGHQKLADEMMTILRQLLPEHRSELQQAIAEQSLTEIRFHAHKLHGASSYCGVPALKAISGLVEQSIDSEQTEQLEPQLQLLLTTIDRLMEHSAELPPEPPSPPHTPAHPRP